MFVFILSPCVYACGLISWLQLTHVSINLFDRQMFVIQARHVYCCCFLSLKLWFYLWFLYCFFLHCFCLFACFWFCFLFFIFLLFFVLFCCYLLVFCFLFFFLFLFLFYFFLILTLFTKSLHCRDLYVINICLHEISCDVLLNMVEFNVCVFH